MIFNQEKIYKKYFGEYSLFCNIAQAKINNPYQNMNMAFIYWHIVYGK